MALRRGRRTNHRERRGRAAVRILVSTGVALAGFALLGPSLDAHAEITPGCSGHINGVDVAGVNSQDANTAIPIDENATVQVDLSGDTGSPPTVHTDYGLVGGFSLGKDANGTTTSVKVSDYAKVTGLYLVQATTGPNHNCSAAALVKIGGSPFSSYLGWIALGGMAVGGAALTAGTVVAATGPASIPTPDPSSSASTGPITDQDLRDAADAALGQGASTCCCGPALPMAFLMTAVFMTGAMPAASGGPGAGARIPRARWRPRLSFFGVVGALVGSLFAVVFMELNGNVYPTRAYTVKALVAGLLAGLILPSLARHIAVRRTNKKIAVRFADIRARRAAAATVPVYETPAPPAPAVAEVPPGPPTSYTPPPPTPAEGEAAPPPPPLEE
jgi:hypothetical protein